MQILSKTT